MNPIGSQFNLPFFVPEESFQDRISKYLPNEVYSAYWYFGVDGSDVHVADVNRLLVNINTVKKHSEYLLSETRLSISPKEALWQYRGATQSLTILLYAFSVPIFGLIFSFISMVSRLSIECQRNEIAILRSRGASQIQILGLISLEGLVLGFFSFAISLPITVQLTKLIQKTRGLLDLAGGVQDLRVEIRSSSLEIGLASIGLILLAMIIPAIDAARHTIIPYKQ
jgi:putative ABC transport system permease protein